MRTEVTLRPVREDDLPVLDGFLLDPEIAGEFQSYGWQDLGRWRRRWAGNGLLGDDGGMLMVESAGDRLGLVSWTGCGFRKGRWRDGVLYGILREDVPLG